MNLVQLTPGAGAMYCGNCLRDNSLVAALRKLGHGVLMVPLYLPLTLDEPDQSAGVPIFFGGINVYLQQKSSLFRSAPAWFRNLLASPRLLKWAAGKAAKTRPAELGELTLSMLRGEEGRQRREVEELIAWLKTQPRPDVVCLSNALLLGLARRLKADLGVPVACMLQGEDAFLDALPESHRAACWKTVSERAAEADLLVAPSHYFGELMRRRLDLPAGRVQVVWNGINPNADESGLQEADSVPESGRGRLVTEAPILGFFARMCREKGLEAVVQAFIAIKQRSRVPQLRLRIGGSCGPADEPFVASIQARLRAAHLLDDVEFHPNLDRAAKLAFLRSLSVFSVPALINEAFGLYVLEAMAAGVPVVLPRTGAFPEIIEATKGGVLCAPNDPSALADAIEKLLLDPARARALGEAGRQAVRESFNAQTMAREMARVFGVIVKR